jgi:uncharacterized protein
MEFDGFDWDSGNRDKCQKHGVSLAEIESVFDGRFLSVRTQSMRRPNAARAIGVTGQGRHVFVVFTWRLLGHRKLIRPISARYMHKKEVAAHEKEIP